MSIYRFQFNIPVRMFLTRTDGIPAPSKFPDGGTQFQWKARTTAGEEIRFYADADLHTQILRFAGLPNILATELEIVKRAVGNKHQWIVQTMNGTNPPQAGAQNTVEAPSNGDAEKTPGVQKLVRLWMQCYLEVCNANKTLNGHALQGEELRSVTTSIFIACTNKNYAANLDRLRILLDGVKQPEPPITPEKIQEEFRGLMQTVIQPKPELEYIPTNEKLPWDDQPEQPASPPKVTPPTSATTTSATDGAPKLSPTKVQSLTAAAATKHIAIETLISELRVKLNLPKLKALDELPEKHFGQACTILNRIKIE